MEESSEEDEPKPKAAYKMPTMPGAGSDEVIGFPVDKAGLKG